ncbi:complement factor H-related protein 2-like [Styela clava]|uniref:complement factor H-related protein 2-like n=1 Tax=Styela clava TaxID=7725 RepID=UPI00193AAEA3|nr:complement factor H-related protein 2-like [Styela clava]
MERIRDLFALVVAICVIQLSDAACQKPLIKNGYVLPDYGQQKLYSAGERAMFSCFLALRRIGPAYAVCQGNGQWTEVATCFNPQKFCPPEEAEIKNGSPLNGPIQGKFYNGMAVHYICKYGYKLPSPRQYKNMCKNGKWEYVKPECKEIDYRPLRKYWDELSFEERVTYYSIFGK